VDAPDRRVRYSLDRVAPSTMADQANEHADEQLSRGRRLLVLAICCLGLLIVGLDTTIDNVALRSIHSSLHASVSGLMRAGGSSR
jgi:hypothetical protein